MKTPNEVHQFDLSYMPSDTLYEDKYKYICLGINVSSRYKVAIPLRTKQVKHIAEIITNIYKVDPLTYPEVFQCDNGSEFKAEVTKVLEKHRVKIWRMMTKYKNMHMSFVKALNKVLAENLFKVQDAQELKNLENVSSIWVKHLYGLIDQLNDTETQMTGMKPKEAIEINKVPLVESYPPEDTLPEDGLLQPGKEHNEQCKRATDRIWSKTTYRLSKVAWSPGDWVMYYLANGLEKAFRRAYAHF